MVGIAHVHDRAAFGVRAVQPLDARAARDRRFAKAELRQDAEAGRLQQESGADGFQLCALLEDLDVVAVAREENRGGLPGGAVSDDRDPHRRPLPMSEL
jgi:3-hydroxyacyl-CoA dehydrogenase